MDARKRLLCPTEEKALRHRCLSAILPFMANKTDPNGDACVDGPIHPNQWNRLLELLLEKARGRHSGGC